MDKQSSSQIKANPISNENVEEPDVQEKNEVEQIEEQKHTQGKKQKYLKPDFTYCPNNKNAEDLVKTYPHLESLKKANELDLDTIGEAESFVIRSNNDDDIHKAIKYEVWCSTPPNNEMLDQAYKAAQAANKDIYLFYSVVKSGQFVGVAKLKSGLQEETFAYWWQHSKWRGHFKIEWLFIKDITYKQFETLKNENQMSVTRSKDGTRIDWKETGLPMLRIYQASKDEPNIFQDFEHMDQREQFQRYIRSTQAQGQYQQQGQQQNMYSQYPNSQMMYYQQQYQQYHGQQQGQQSQMAYYHPYYQQYYQQPRFNNAYPPTNNHNHNQHRPYQNNNQQHKKYYNNKKQHQNGQYNNNGNKHRYNNKNYNNQHQHQHHNQQNQVPKQQVQQQEKQQEQQQKQE